MKRKLQTQHHDPNTTSAKFKIEGTAPFEDTNKKTNKIENS